MRGLAIPDTRAVQCVDTVLTIMADSAVKEWLLLNTPVTVNKKEVLLPDYEDVDSSEGSV